MTKGQGDEQLRRFLPPGWTVQRTKDKSPLLITKEGLALSLDFSVKQALSRRQPLAKALGFKGKPLSVLDITAGWAKDAFLMAQLGCAVTAVESHPFVFYFVQESLKLLGKRPIKLNFILDNSLNYLNNFKDSQGPDVIFIDPMFGERKKSLSSKALRILKEIVGEAKERDQLLELALTKAKKRVVVKRHRLETPIRQPAVCSFKGRSVCYDVFRPKRGAGF